MIACQHCGKQHPPGAPSCPLTGESMQARGLVGTRVDRYQVERLLGAGGFGSVFLAKHVHTDATVALKLLKKSLGADQQMLERFLREARAAASVGSEHIVRVMDAGLSAEGQAFLALEYLDGNDLKELAAREGPLAPLRLVMVVLQALEALEAAHAKGIVHRDMKPANVFVVRRRDERGTERDFVKLLDFGISKMKGDAATSGLTMTGVAMGTPSYMAPEQFFDARSVDARADLYSVSAMLYELLSGKLPFDAESYAHLIVKVRTEQAAPLNQVAPQLPIALAQVVMVGLAKEPGQRWQSAREFGEALRSAMGLPPPGNTPSFLPSQSGTQPGVARPEVAVKAPGGDDVGRLMEKTYTPQPRPSGSPHPAAATPAPSSAWVVPSSGSANTGLPIAAPQPSAPPAKSGWVVPSSGSANTGLPIAAPQPGAPRPPSAPAQSGWVAQPGPTPMALPPPRQTAQPPAQPSGSSSLKWVAIIIGILTLSCCMCGGLVKIFASEKQDPPSFEQPAPQVAPVVDPELEPDVEDLPDEEAAVPEPDPAPEPAPEPAPPKRPNKRKVK